MSSKKDPQPLKQGLERVLNGLGSPEIGAITTLVDRWPEVVGLELASRVQAVAIRGSELVVQVDDPGWASQISWLETRLLERIAGLVGPGRITAVRARVAPRSGLYGVDQKS